MSLRSASLAVLLVWTSACAVTRKDADPTVLVETRAGRELGVSTDWGIVFLGQSARFGRADVVVWYGDGPSIEPSVVEPVGGGLHVLEIEIRPPTVGIVFEEPEAGTWVDVVGRNGAGRWRARARVASHPGVEGLLLEVPPELDSPSDQVGAGVFVPGIRGRESLLGLVSGRVVLESAAGRAEYLTVVGPRDLWRLVAYRRTDALRHPFVYRDDVL
ncbi:MAG: hypothetical protein GC161_07495 [Planctomycetaceae bacterium]|nr:hypothetical protein [Planctomycetaceae bacterium]